jgi:hypothetical protein
MTDDEQGDGLTEGESTGDRDLDRQVADLEQSRDKLQERIEETRSDWESKKGDQSVPGASPDPDEDSEDSDSVWVDESAGGGDDAG